MSKKLGGETLGSGTLGGIMAVEVLVPDNPVTTGKKLTKIVPSAANVYKFANDGDCLLFVKAGAVESKVKVVIQAKVDGIAVVAREVAVKEGLFCLGRFELSKYNNEEGQVEFTITVATELEIYVVKSS
jgi:hypothetical protein